MVNLFNEKLHTSVQYAYSNYILQCDGLSPITDWEFFSSPLCPDWLWGSASLLPNGYQGLFPWG